MFKKAYGNHNTIAEATRYLVHQIFGKYGVIVVDGDDTTLKSLAIPAFKAELTANPSYEAMKLTNAELSETGYNLQVKPHEINLFYLAEELRERIELSEDGTYKVVNTNIVFTKDEILKELAENPQKFSPNVVLRPLYQEIIMPNLAYIGGGGELAYWFQLKDVFKAFKTPFPILMLRNSVMVVSGNVRTNIEQLGIGTKQLFGDIQSLENQLVRAETSESLELDLEREKLELLFLEIESKLKKINPSLDRSVRSGLARADKVLISLEKKMMRAERRKQEVLVNKLHMVCESLMPRNGLQERNMNFTPFYLEYGDRFVDVLLENLNPFDFSFTILEEEL